MNAYSQEFIEVRKKDLYRMQEELRTTLQLETNQFNELMRELAYKDFPEVSRELLDRRTLGEIEVAERERLRSIASALYRVEQQQYGMCTACGGAIDEERLKAKPDAALCFSCRQRLESDRSH